MELIQTVITALVGSIGGALSAILIARLSKTRKERDGETKNLDAKTESEITKAAESIASGSTVAISNLLRSIEYQNAEIEKIKKARAERDIETQKERDELQARIQADLIETQRLRNEHALQQRQLLRVEDLAIRAGEYIDKIKTAVQNIPGVDLPLNGELMDSVMRLKLEREKRAK